MYKFTNLLLRQSANSNKLVPLIRFNRFSSSLKVAESKKDESDSVGENIIKPLQTKPLTNVKSNNNMVAAAFASLHSEERGEGIKTPVTDEKIKNAKNIDQLLSISEGTGVSRKHALKVVSVLADWSTSGKVKISEFEADPRFIRLCKILTKNGPNTKINRNSLASRSEDLSTILSVTADDEAAKLVGSITLPQMVKVMSTLSQKRRRSTLLLRALAYNITASPERLNLKQAGDLLFSMSTLNFPDENLLHRVSNDVILELEGGLKKSAVVGSIITSLGLLKYKNPGLLDSICEWVLKNHSLCRPQDIFSLFMTLAVLNYSPTCSEQLFQTVIPPLTQPEAGKSVVWLELVWSLVLLKQVTDVHISSILDESFINKLQESKALTTSSKLKLLNIDATVRYLLKSYSGPKLPIDSPIRNTEIAQSKEKNEMVEAVIDALRSLIHSDQCLKTKINTGHGFFIDAECLLDKRCNPLPLSSTPPSEASKIAILTHDYHDMCRGRVDPTGINSLAVKILEAKGYKVLVVPYTEFKPNDKIIHRVQYLESKLKELIKP